MSFVPGKDSDGFYGLAATLNVRPAAGDSLSPFWDFVVGGVNADNLLVRLHPDAGFPCPTPWAVKGAPTRIYDRIAGGAEIQMLYAVRADRIAPIRADTLYCFARLEFQHRKSEPMGCAKPACIEWSYAQMGFARDDVVHVRSGGSRFVSWNSPGGAVCGSIKAPARPTRWSPPAQRKK
jgi:hypothetical protein